jgi:hypothetical protein
VIETARERRRSVADESTKSLDHLRTRDDWRRRLESELAAEYRPGRWNRLSDALLKTGLPLLTIVSLLAVLTPDFTDRVGSISGTVGAGVLAGGLSIVAIRGVEHDLVPALRLLATDPSEALREVWEQP